MIGIKFHSASYLTVCETDNYEIVNDEVWLQSGHEKGLSGFILLGLGFDS